METLHIALKEWDLTIRELLAGRQAILLRKGGILEAENQFELEHPRFLFFPTFVHQNPDMVKAGKRPEIRSLPAEPTEVEIAGYGEVARILEVPSRAAMDALRDLHIWDERLIDMRFSYRAEKPLYLVVVRAFSLPAPVRLANTAAYAGCKSWVPLEREVPIGPEAGAAAAMPEPALQAIIGRIERTFRSA
jgi:hypothetical protein